MSIEKIKRKRGTGYRVRIMRDGKMFVETFDRRYDAEQYQKKIADGGVMMLETELTFAQASDHWMKNHAEVYKSPAGIAGDHWVLSKNVLPFLGPWKLRKITIRQIEELIAALKKKGLANNSVKRNLDVVKAIFNYFVRRQVLSYNPMSALGRWKMDEADIRFWNKEEAARFLSRTEAKYRGTRQYAFHLFYKVALHTGMRLGELLALKWSAIDFQNRLIKVCRSYCEVSKDIRETTKSRRIRHVPLGEGVFDDLRKAYEERQQSELVFHLNGSVLDHANLRNRHFNRDIREAGVSKIRIHDMRHTYASHFMMNGGNIYALQAILGHSDLKMTQRYAHFSKTYFTEKADIVRFGDGKVIQADFGQKTGTAAD